jgi:hypothetical protein
MPVTNGRSVSYGNNSSRSSPGNPNPPRRRRSGFVGASTAYFLFAPPKGPPQKSLLPSTSLAARREEPSISVGHETPFQKSGMSAEHLRRLAWAEIGCSPMKHVTSLRMRQATLLFQATGLNGFRGRRSGGIEKCVCLQHSLQAANRFQPWGFFS